MTDLTPRRRTLNFIFLPEPYTKTNSSRVEDNSKVHFFAEKISKIGLKNLEFIHKYTTFTKRFKRLEENLYEVNTHFILISSRSL